MVDGDACDGHTCGMDHAGDLVQIRGLLDEYMDDIAGGHINRRDAHLVSGVAQDLCCRVGVVLPEVRQQDVLADADPAWRSPSRSDRVR